MTVTDTEALTDCHNSFVTPVQSCCVTTYIRDNHLTELYLGRREGNVRITRDYISYLFVVVNVISFSC